MRNIVKVAGAVAALAVSAQTAQALVVKNFFSRCSPGAVRACASLQVTTQANMSGGTTVTIKVRNEQGNPAGWLLDNTGGSIIRRIGIIFPTIVNATGLVVGTEGSVGVVGTSPDQYWIMREPGGLGGLIELTVGVQFNNYGGIMGCSTANTPVPAYYQTCNTAGFVTFTFDTQNSWTADQAEVAWLTMYNSVDGVECGTNQPSEPRLDCQDATVPEPITMVLLGTGLAGVGGAGFVRRRREQNGDVSNG